MTAETRQNPIQLNLKGVPCGFRSTTLRATHAVDTYTAGTFSNSREAWTIYACVYLIIGHESELVSRNYTHVDEATKREAIRKLPVLTESLR